jgi:trimeric autotransporter adhesin
MIRKFTNGLMALSLILFLNSCNDDEVSPPPKTTFTVDKTSGLANDTEFTFVVNEVDAKSISLLPYGTEKLTLGGQLIPKSSFVDGKATVKFTYAQVGSFNAVVVTNNATGDGEFANTYSDPIAISITSDRNSLAEFAVEGSSKIETVGNNITVTVPFGTSITAVKPKFAIPAFSTVTVGGAAVKSGETALNFTTPQVFAVKAQNGTVANYTVNFVVTPVETVNTIKSASGKESSKNAGDKLIPGYVDNSGRRIILYDTLGTPSTRFDSVKLGYVLDGKFAIVKYAGKKIGQDVQFNLTSSKQIVVYGQDSVQAAYTVYAAAAPRLTVDFPGLTSLVGVSQKNFDIELTVLSGTTLQRTAETNVTLPVGVTVTGINVVQMNTAGTAEVSTPFVSNVTVVDFSKATIFELMVTDPTVGNYRVRYNVKVTKTP